jgi:hypothetical protein
MFYLPFFFKPGDELIFHPSFRYSDREGYIIQTTTYFLGRPEQQQASGGLSFLQMQEEDEGYRYERRGLFLHRTGMEREDSWVVRSDSHVKMILDYYTHQGLFFGIDSLIADLDHLSELQVLAGAGFSSYLFSLPGYSEAYTPYRLDEETGEFTTETQQPWVLGMPIPFRFGFDLSMDLDWEQGGISLQAPLYSDPYFRNRFTGRQETLGLEQFTSPDAETESGTAGSTLYTDPVFTLRSRYHPDVDDILAPFVTSFSLDYLEARLRLSQEDRLPMERTIETESPIGYYYPDVLTPVDTSLSIEGALFSSDSGGRERQDEEGAEREGETESGTGESAPSPPEGLKPPSEEGANRAEKDDSAGEIGEFGEIGKEEKIPPLRPAEEREAVAPTGGFDHRLYYDFSSNLQYHTIYGNNEEADLTDIGFDPTYSSVSTAGSGDWRYRAELAGERLTLENTVGLDGKVRRHYREDPATNISGYLEQDRKASYISVGNDLRITGALFPAFRRWNGSTLQYRLESDMYDLRYDSAAETHLPNVFRWEEEYLDTHETQLDMVFAETGRRFQFSNRTVLPPLDLSTRFNLQMHTDSVDASASMQIREGEEAKPVYGPLEIKGTLRFWSASRFTQKLMLLEEDGAQSSVSELEFSFFDRNLRLLQTLEWNIAAEEPQQSFSSLDLWWFSLDFDVRKASVYELEGFEWRETETERFAPYQFSAGIDYSYEPDPLWKRRVRLAAFVDSTVRADLRRFTDSSLVFGAGVRGSVAEFADFNFRISSENTAVYRYVPAWAEQVGRTVKNPVDDLLDSLSLLDTLKRQRSSFNLNSLSLELVHHMPDWDLNIDYRGSYEINEEKTRYEWESEFTISLQWNPIPIVRREMIYEDDQFSF